MRSKRHEQKRSSPAPADAGQFRDVDIKELRAALERARTQVLSPEDHALLCGAVDTFTALTAELQLKGVTLERLRRLFLGSSSEKTSKVLKDDENGDTGKGKHTPPKKKKPDDDKAPGHGRNGATAYTGAKHEQVEHESLHSGDPCPGCKDGKVHPMKEPSVRVRVHGMAPLDATIWECDRFRCGSCGEVFTAQAPEGVGPEKYDESADAMVAMLRYGVGVPFNRLERLQEGMGIPLPASTQWDLVERRVESLEPAHDALVRHAAQGEVFHNDDTSMRVLELDGQTREDALAAGASEKEADRTGVRTSGIVSKVGERRVALYFTGRQLAGEGLDNVLQERMVRLPTPIQMCDALAHNLPSVLETMLANCLCHARRYYVDIVPTFPDEAREVLETLAEVFRNDAIARKEKMTDQQRLKFHQQHSGPLMEKLKIWLHVQLDAHLVEPNSPLGEAIRYMLKHWPALTLFLREAGAPLDNNICERALKKAILHRRNSLFYRTVYGAYVGDLYMGLIHTAELNGVNPFAYLVALMRNADDVAKNPQAWLPWNYEVSASALTGANTSG